MVDDEDDDLAKQALDYFMENETLKRKVYPYVCGIALFNLIMFVMLAYLVYRLTAIL